MDLAIRDASNKDCENVKYLIFTVLKEYGLVPDPESTDKDLEDIEAEYINNNGYFGVVEQGDRIIATVGVRRMSASTCEIRKMYCLPECRGKGLGRQLLQHAISMAKQRGYSRAVLETASPLKEAIALYKKFGFKPYSPTHIAARCDQAYELDL